MFLGKRDRLIRTGWRHGIVGVDDSDADNAQCFYKSDRDIKRRVYQDKNIINA